MRNNSIYLFFCVIFFVCVVIYLRDEIWKKKKIKPKIKEFFDNKN